MSASNIRESCMYHAASSTSTCGQHSRRTCTKYCVHSSLHPTQEMTFPNKSGRNHATENAAIPPELPPRLQRRDLHSNTALVISCRVGSSAAKMHRPFQAEIALCRSRTQNARIWRNVPLFFDDRQDFGCQEVRIDIADLYTRISLVLYHTSAVRTQTLFAPYRTLGCAAQGSPGCGQE